MALTLNNYTGFETQGGEEAASIAGSPTYPTTDPRSGSANLLLNGIADEYDLPWVEAVTDAGNDYIIGFAIKYGTTSNESSASVALSDSGGSRILDLRLNASAKLVLRDDGNNIVITANDAVGTAAYHFIELYFQHLASGNAELFLDGGSQGTTSATDFLSAGSLNSDAILQFLYANNNLQIDDIYILSGATSASDRLSNGADAPYAEVFKYQSTKNSTTPDDGGTTLNAGTWDKAGETPGAATATSPEYTDAGAGAVDSDNTNGSPEGPKNDARIDGDSNIKAIKGIWIMQRSGGGATAHYGLLGNDGDGTTRSTDLDPTTAFANYFMLSESAAIKPLSTEYCRIGFETDGAQDFECQEMWAMLLHVPAAVGPPPIINLVMAPYTPA